MKQGNFYFIKNEYFDKFPEEPLCENKEIKNGHSHDRACFMAFEDDSTGLFWMVPISSQVDKYEKIYNAKIKRNGKCDTIVFGYVLGHKKAFLIQNMSPISEDYVKNAYLHNGVEVKIDNDKAKEILKKAKKVIKLTRKGMKILFPDVLRIEQQLLKEKNEKSKDTE